MSVQKPREIAVRVLSLRQTEEEFVEKLLEAELATANISPVDRGLCQELTYGIVRWQKTLDWLIDRKTNSQTQIPTVRILLQLGLYQMFWLTRIPNHAAVHETVELVKKLGFTPQSGFVNAVLRTYTRERVETEKVLAELKISQPGLGFSHPEWLVQRWQNRLGAEKAAHLMQWNNNAPSTYARINTLKTDAAKILQRWETEGVQAIPRSFDWVDDNVVFQLDSHPPLASLPSFKQGLFYIQDPSTLLSVRELDPHPAETILDLCAAPGGKTTFIAQQMQNRGKIFAQDNQADRLDLIRENYVRMGITCVEASLAPTDIIVNPSRKFDRVLVDAPCSNTGVLRRRIDLRWRVEPEEVVRLSETQLQILRQAGPRVKPGGILVYSTCSLEPEENSELVKAFLAENADFKLERERELLPFENHVDGAYVARMKRS